MIIKKLAKFTDKEVREFKSIEEVRIAVNSRIFNRNRSNKNWNILEHINEIKALFVQVKLKNKFIIIDEEEETNKILNYYKNVILIPQKENPITLLQNARSLKKISEICKNLNVSDNELRKLIYTYNVGTGNKNSNDLSDPIVVRYHCFYNGRRIAAKRDGTMLPADLNKWNRNELISGLWFVKIFHEFEKYKNNSLLDLLYKNNFAEMNKINNEDKEQLYYFLCEYETMAGTEEYGN